MLPEPNIAVCFKQTDEADVGYDFMNRKLKLIADCHG